VYPERVSAFVGLLTRQPIAPIDSDRRRAACLRVNMNQAPSVKVRLPFVARHDVTVATFANPY
jgi:hypothetical protein